MRVFVAIDIPEAVRAAIAEFVRRVAPACPEARWVRLTGLHVTLKFLGEVSSEKIAAINSALSTVPRTAPIRIDFRSVGFFPHERRARVFWAGSEASPDLSALAETVEAALAPLRFPRESRSFTPHLTLARFKETPRLEKLQAAIAAVGALEFGHAHATEFHLFESILKRGGAEYTRLATFSISGSASQ